MLCQQFSEAKAQKDNIKASKLQAQIVEKSCNGQIRPGEVKAINTKEQFCVDVTTTPDKLSAKVKWYPEKDYLRVEADVVDATFSTEVPDDRFWRASCAQIFVCPTGRDQDICQFFVAPVGPENKPKMLAVRHQRTGLDYSKVKAAWERTAKGYALNVRIPWDMLSGYSQDWKMMPVEFSFSSNTPNGLAQYTMNRTKTPWSQVRGYAALVRK